MAKAKAKAKKGDGDGDGDGDGGGSDGGGMIGEEIRVFAEKSAEAGDHVTSHARGPFVLLGGFTLDGRIARQQRQDVKDVHP
jgi:hypothetical protein